MFSFSRHSEIRKVIVQNLKVQASCYELCFLSCCSHGPTGTSDSQQKLLNVQFKQHYRIAHNLITILHSMSEDSLLINLLQQCNLSWNPKVRCCVHKSPPLESILSQMYPIHTFGQCFLNIHLNMVLLFVPRSSQVGSSVWVFVLKCCMHFHFSHACYVTHSFHPY